MARRRLDQVDAMRPIKQAGVISTHSILYFAPAAASVGSGAALLLLHVSREGFFFISACMLTLRLRRPGRGPGCAVITAAGACRSSFPTCAGRSSTSSTCCRPRTTRSVPAALAHLASMA